MTAFINNFVQRLLVGGANSHTIRHFHVIFLTIAVITGLVANQAKAATDNQHQ
jgi:hypothetical protein